MIFVSFNQLKAVYITLFAGITIFVFVSLLKIIFQFNRCNLILKNLQIGLFSLIYGVCFVAVINITNYGKYNLSLVLFYLTLILFATKSSTKLVDFLSSKVYSIYKKIFRWGKFYFARKIKSLED